MLQGLNPAPVSTMQGGQHLSWKAFDALLEFASISTVTQNRLSDGHVNNALLSRGRWFVRTKHDTLSLVHNMLKLLARAKLDPKHRPKVRGSDSSSNGL
jgi:hypothetical protein